MAFNPGDILPYVAAIGSVAVGLASFFFAIRQTKVRGPTLDFIDMTIDKLWGTMKNSREGTYDVRRIGFFGKDFGEVKEMSLNYLKFSTVIVNTGDRACHYRTLGMRLKLCFPYKPSKSERMRPAARSFSGKKLEIESKIVLNPYHRRYITTAETEDVKNRILLPSFASEWYDGELEIAGKFWDHKGKCRFIYTTFDIDRHGSTKCNVNKQRRLPEFDIKPKKGLRRSRTAKKLIFELEETKELEEPPEEQLISRVSKVEEALKALGMEDLDKDQLLEEQKRRLLELEKELTKPVDSLRKEELDVETEELDVETEELDVETEDIDVETEDIDVETEEIDEDIDVETEEIDEDIEEDKSRRKRRKKIRE